VRAAKWVRAVLAAVLLTGFQVTARAEAPIRDHDIEAEDYFSLGVISAVAASPDGRQVAYCEMRWEPPAEKRNTDLWVVDRTTKDVRRLTFDAANDRAPQWSPDGKLLYFLSNPERNGEKAPPYDGKSQVWRIAADGGEPFPVTRAVEGVGGFALSSDGSTLYYTTSKKVVDEEWKALREEFKELEYGHGVTKFSQVWKLDLVNWRSEKLVDEKRVVADFKVATDGRIAMISRPDETLLSNEGWSRVDLYDPASKKVEVITGDGWRSGHPSPYGWIDSVEWSQDGAALAFTVSFDGYPTKLYVVKGPPSGGLVEVERPEGVEVNGGTVQWRGEGSGEVCFVGQHRARQRVYCVSNPTGERARDSRTLTDGDVVVTAFSFPRSGNPLIVAMDTTTVPGDLYVFPKADDFQRITRINPQVDTWKLPQISVVRWEGAGGEAVEGILELPPEYKPGIPLPMVVELHGGPTAATLYRMRFWIYGRTLLAAKGYALLSPNYRGSTGYGDKFMTDLIGRENNIEVEDILKGVDAMVVQGIADPERLGVMGWSNGGFLTNCVITATDRFKAASSGAGVLDMVIQWGTEDTPGHVINYMQALPWRDAAAYEKASPLYRLDQVKTPTLIHVGGNDPRVPPAHSRALYRALKHYLSVPTELVVYPNEGHGLTTYANRKAKMKWDLGWFDRYLLGKPSAESAAEPSPTTN